MALETSIGNDQCEVIKSWATTAIIAIIAMIGFRMQFNLPSNLDEVFSYEFGVFWNSKKMHGVSLWSFVFDYIPSCKK